MEVLLKDFPVVAEIRMAWGEMDAMQHLNNVVYFRYFETARLLYAERVGMWEHMKATGVGPILHSTGCRYKIPLTYPDTLTVGTRVIKVEKDRLVMDYVLVSGRLHKIAATGDAVIVSFNYREGKKVHLPEEWKRRVLEIEGEGRLV
jgi:acyl-CoA thioester hydrolase